MKGLTRGLVVLSVAFFLSRAFFLMVVMGEHYSSLASGNLIDRETIAARRGVIMDRNEKLIAGNIDRDGKIVRNYPDGEVTASVVGYIGDTGGVTGLEREYQDKLSGKPGERVVEKTAAGKEIREVERTEPVSGDTLKLNLDLGLQTSVYRALKEKLAEVGMSGSAVVSKVNGEVLALVSLPSYDPNLFVTNGKRGSEGGIYATALDVIKDEDKKPLFNRAIAGNFAPGSVYKVVTALTGLQEKTITADDLIADSGELVVGNYKFGNWYFEEYGRTEGQINVKKALARSNDIFFYKLGEMIGVDKMVSWSKKIGLGSPTNIDLWGEASGLMPSPLWSEKVKGERWFLGNTYHLSIGQGDLLATPLQINRMTAAAVSGKRCEPRLFGKGNCEDIGLSETSRNIVLDGMQMACTQGGTAYPFFDLKGRVICKTGTAQHGSEKDQPHAWLTAVIPDDESARTGKWNYTKADSWIVITVMIEDGGEGSAVAAPVARKIADAVLAGEK